ncbi:MAG: FAD-dependent oxidoreductase [Lactobacillus sp.]|uniref:FAD-dependent oxidoreductase n=1 Tax=Limosilactobacillus coleohominis TaxID=181675 RepID=UPI002A911209|nr:FAD-dependent oxidoreductase [Limosilactobacillus coleohominis]MCI5812696.1 FAD-dependent oxidoreductase [Lactobacillus sp.]MDY5629572.1 FAD-dependent oxidoreductase [Limosilactobacillus coleohominis]
MQKVQNIVIGFGKGGKTLAKFLAQRGEEVLVVERSTKMYGGTCINIACLPSKRLVTEAARGTDFAAAIQGKIQMVKQLRDKNYHMLADEETVTVLDGMAHFTGNHTIAVKTASGLKEFEGERIFINTGATPNIPTIPGLKDSQNLLTSTTAMELPKLPKKLVIIGAGYIGLEFAAMFASFGAHVTMLDHHATFLAREDDDVATMVAENLRSLGVEIKMDVTLKKVLDQDQQTILTYEENNREQTVTADKVLVAAGRHPVTENLGLENTDIQLASDGAIKVDSHLHTTVPNVWAIGDVKGGPQFTYISLDDLRIIKSELYGDGTRQTTNRGVVPTSVFIEPPLSQVGLTEKQAQVAGKHYELFKMPVAAIPKAKVLKDQRGMLKMLVDPDTKTIIGATIYAPESHEIINMVALAMRAQLPYTMLRDQIYTHPTISEAFNDLLKNPVN